MPDNPSIYEEHRRNLSESQKGRVFSEETRAKMRAARQRYLNGCS
jgi:hypothetical protein